MATPTSCSSGVRLPTATISGAYVVRSRGVSTAARMRAGTPQAERTVAQYAVLEVQSDQCRGRLVQPYRADKNGNSGSLSGNDGCGATGPLAGVAVPTVPGYTGHTGPTSGSPPI